MDITNGMLEFEADLRNFAEKLGDMNYSIILKNVEYDANGKEVCADATKKYAERLGNVWEDNTDPMTERMMLLLHDKNEAEPWVAMLNDENNMYAKELREFIRILSKHHLEYWETCDVLMDITPKERYQTKVLQDIFGVDMKEVKRKAAEKDKEEQRRLSRLLAKEYLKLLGYKV